MKRTQKQIDARNNFKLELNDKGYPIAYMEDDGKQAVVECCPLCGERHFHGTGSTYSHKVADCTDENRSKWQQLHPEIKPYANSGYYVSPR